MRRIIFFFILLACFSTAVNSVETTPVFDPVQANKTLDKLSIKLSIENLNVIHLDEAIALLTDLQTQAKACISEGETNLEDIKKKLKTIETEKAEETKLTADLKYLTKKRVELTNRVAECRLFVFRSDEAIQAFQATVARLVTGKILTAEPSIWSNIVESIKQPENIVKNLDIKQFVDNSGILWMNLPFIAIIVLLISIGFFIEHKLKNILNKNQKQPLNPRKYAKKNTNKN